MQIGLDVFPCLQDLVLAHAQVVRDIAEMAIGERPQVVGDERLGDPRHVVSGLAQMGQLHQEGLAHVARPDANRLKAEHCRANPRDRGGAATALRGDLFIGPGQQAVLVQLADDSALGSCARRFQSRCSWSVNEASARAMGSSASGSSRAGPGPGSKISVALGPSVRGEQFGQLPPKVGPPQVGQMTSSISSRAGFSSSSSEIACCSSTELIARMRLATICLGVTFACIVGRSWWLTSIDIGLLTWAGRSGAARSARRRGRQ